MHHLLSALRAIIVRINPKIVIGLAIAVANVIWENRGRPEIPPHEGGMP